MTKPTKLRDIKRDWFLIDAQGKILGRLATNIAHLLVGKEKPYFVRYLDCGNFVIVVNAAKIRVTGKKEEQKKYFRHSGYPAGLKEESLKRWRQEKPEQIIIHAVRGMLPQNKLRDRVLKRLYVFAGEEHPYKNKLKIEN